MRLLCVSRFNDAHAKERGRRALIALGQHTSAVRQLCGRVRTERVAALYRAYHQRPQPTVEKHE